MGKASKQKKNRDKALLQKRIAAIKLKNKIAKMNDDELYIVENANMPASLKDKAFSGSFWKGYFNVYD